MIWYLMLETIDQYEEGEEYASLPDDLMEDYPDSFKVIEEEQEANLFYNYKNGFAFYDIITLWKKYSKHSQNHYEN